MDITAKFSRSIYGSEGAFFMVALYKPVEDTVNPIGQPQSFIKMVGANLPLRKGVSYVFHGQWEFENKKGRRLYSFKVASFDEVLPKDGAGLIKYLTTLDGIGPKTAENIYIAFGSDVFSVLDNDIEKLLEVKGVSKRTFNRVKSCWLQKSAGKELFAYLCQYEVPDKVILKIYERYEAAALHVVKNEPYSLLDIYGFGFKTADQIARRENLPLCSMARIRASVLEAISQHENCGHTCVTWHDMLYPAVMSILYRGLSSAQRESLDSGIKSMEDKAGKPFMIILFKICTKMTNSLFIDKSEDVYYFFRRDFARKELGIAKNIERLLEGKNSISGMDSDKLALILNRAIEEGVLVSKLSPGQSEAVCRSLNNNFSIICGGPGTGKTFLQKAILYTAKALVPDITVQLLAPTGKASHRMTESTGYPASTIHSALGLYDSETAIGGGGINQLEADLIIVDESSMIDVPLANILFASIKDNAKIILVGDDKQLPSVGPGSVLRELIDSDIVPKSMLKSVFRQAKGSSIGYNASRIIHGNTQMIEDDSFSIVEIDGSEKIAEETVNQYSYYVNLFGLENVAVLSPFREKTETGVNLLNKRLQRHVFPDTPAEGLGFITGDRVMYTRNANGLTNGDVGIITNISRSCGDLVITAEFNGEEFHLEGEDISSLVLAYATTVHKSQGSEFSVVIIVMDPAHSKMHKQKIIYTAITRSKKKVVIIGSRDAFIRSVQSDSDEQRLSRLGHFLKNRLSEKPVNLETKKREECEQLEMEF